MLEADALIGPRFRRASTAALAAGRRSARGERGGELGRRGEAVLRSWRECPRDRLVHGRGDRGLAGARRTPDRRLTDEHFVEHAPEAVDVAPSVERSAAGGLLRAHVRRRADRHPRDGEHAPARRADRPSDPEVADHRVAGFEQDVLRLDVAVHKPVAVGVAQRVRHFPCDLERLVQRES